MHSFKLVLGVLLMTTCVTGGAHASVEFLSDNPYLISFSQQGWGELGLNTCAFAQGQTPLKLQIGDKTYEKGLGHHAPGEIVVDLEGRYDTFEAEIGVQKQALGQGSVIFQVYVDDEKRFNSGVMHETDLPKPISISVSGAQELTLVVTDAGDGIICDCANWTEARLTPSTSPTPVLAGAERMNMALFAEVVTCNPNRMDGARANRVQEFRTEEIFLEEHLSPSKTNTYSIPSNGCIGLKWMERRLLSEAGLQFTQSASKPDNVQVQGWFGQTTHQGEWRYLKGDIEASGDRWVFPISGKLNPDVRNGLWKIRWILPASLRQQEIREFTAFTKSVWKTTSLSIVQDDPDKKREVSVGAYNGEIIGGSRNWESSEPFNFQARYCTSKRVKYDRTVLYIHLKDDSFAVAVDDILANGCVYVKDAGVFIKPTDSRLTLAEYKNQIANKKTVLEKVREMPDQTFDQAMVKTRNPIQDNGPTMLSLACDNSKFVMEQSGTVRFALTPQGVNPVSYDEQVPCAMIPVFGGTNLGRAERHVEGGWLPIIVSTWKQGNVKYSEKCYVAPYDRSDERLWLNNKPLCVTEFTIENTGKGEADASLSLSFIADVRTNAVATAKAQTVQIGGRVAAVINTKGLNTTANDNHVDLTGRLKPGKKSACMVCIPGWEPSEDDIKTLKEASSLSDETANYWHRATADAMQFEIPEKLLENAIKASVVHCMIATRNEDNGSRLAAWAGADRYGALESETNSIIRGMDLMGQSEFTRRAHDFFIKRYRPEGFLTTGYTLMGTGWQLQTLGQHYDLVHDKDWLKAHALDIVRVCDWIIKQRQKTMRLIISGEKVPEYGLIPPGVMADWGNFLPYFCLSGYYYAGLHEAAEALKDIGHPDADRLLSEAKAFRLDIANAYHRIQARTPAIPLQNGTWVRPYPSEAYHAGPLGDFFPGEDGNRSWCYDVELGAHQMVQQGVLSARTPDSRDIMNHMEDGQFLAGGWFDYPADKNHADWFNMGGFSKVQPYYTRNGEIYALADDVKPFIRSYFNTIAAMLCTENLTLWEHFHNTAAWSKTHETGYFLQHSRFMLLMEQDDELWLAPFVTNNWLKDGMVVAASNAPTNFGPVSYRITSHVGDGFIEVVIDPPTRNAPKAIVIRLRHPDGKHISRVTLNGKPYNDFSAGHSTVTITGDKHGQLKLEVYY